MVVAQALRWAPAAMALLACVSAVASQAPAGDMASFPDGFRWGVATSSYQIEGAVDVGGRGDSIWDTYVRKEGKILNNDTGDIAIDHYNHVEEDLDLLAELGVSMYRFSIAWPRLFPNGEATGEPLPEGIAFYNKIIDGLVARNITPIVTLYHWDLPAALGHWATGERERLLDSFGHYSAACFAAYGDRVKHWVTINEPWVVAILGHMYPIHAPGHSESPGTEPYEAGHVLLLAHLRAYEIFHRYFQPTQGGVIGWSLNVNWRQPRDPNNASDVAAAARSLTWEMDWFAHPIWGPGGDYPALMKQVAGRRLPKFTAAQVVALRNSSDFFGLNHYSTRESFMKPTPAMPKAGGSWDEDKGTENVFNPSWNLTAMGWSVMPSGFEALLLHIQARYTPRGGIWVFENGLAATGEETAASALDGPGVGERYRFYSSYLAAMLRAIKAGADVRGYNMWSMWDNFEWDRGYSMRFGITHVDFKDPERKRTPKPAFHWYKRVIAANKVVPASGDEE